VHEQLQPPDEEPSLRSFGCALGFGVQLDQGKLCGGPGEVFLDHGDAVCRLFLEPNELRVGDLEAANGGAVRLLVDQEGRAERLVVLG